MDANVSNKASGNRLQMSMAMRDLHRGETMLVSYELNSAQKDKKI